MTSIKHGDDAGLADVLASGGSDLELVTVTYAVVGLTNFGERPVPGRGRARHR